MKVPIIGGFSIISQAPSIYGNIIQIIMVKHKKAVVLMSGGVDSTASAIIMKNRGYDVIGVTLDMRSDILVRIDGYCDYVRSFIDSAKNITGLLNIEHRVMDASSLFKEKVVLPFIRMYSEGSTPNPCTLCNPLVKFRLALDVAKEIGADVVASGHYASIGEYKGRKAIMRGAFLEKEQSYFLWGLDREIIERVEFPVGLMSKDDVRKIVQEAGIRIERGESQDVCFLRNTGVGDFIGEFARQREGDIVDLYGNVLGAHRGIAYYTVGQREGLGIGGSGPWFVISIDAKKNRIVVGKEEQLYRSSVDVCDVNINACETDDIPERVSLQIRYRSVAGPAQISAIRDSRAVVTFERPVKAIAPGQSAVIYDGDVLLGGGVIK
jgi:tRNA-specific 2-thiouridylase